MRKETWCARTTAEPGTAPRSRTRSAAGVACLFAAVLVWTMSCHPRARARPLVAVSIFPIYDLVRRVAGPDGDVRFLVPAGQRRDGFAPSSHSVEEVAGAKLGVMVGLGFDGWMEALMKDGAPSARILKVGDRVPTIAVKAGLPDGDAGVIDPHVWLDPARAIVMTKAIGEELARLDPAHADAVRQRADDLGNVLDALDKEVEAKLATCKRREAIQVPSDFRYFADRYHLNLISPNREPALGADVPKLDAVGGASPVDAYEKLVRFNMEILHSMCK